MSNVNNQFKKLINEAIHNHFHDKTELEMTLKDWLYGICEQLDEYEAKNKKLLEELKYLNKVNDDLVWQRDTDEEHEAKAKAYNDTLKTLDKLINDDERYKEARSNDFIAGMLIAYENIFNLMEDYIKEGCGYDAKK